MRAPLTALHLVQDIPQAERDRAVVDAAELLCEELDGLDVDAPGPVGERIRALATAVKRARP